MNILLSFPRSGNSWLRYCIESLSNQKTQGLGGRPHDIGRGIIPELRDSSKPILYKRHTTDEINTNDRLIFLIRNYLVIGEKK